MNRKNKIILAIILLIGGGFSIFASSLPDGLEKVAEDKGFIENGYNIVFGIIPDYTVPKISYESLAVSLAGVFGVLLTFFTIMLLGRIIIKFSKYEK